MNELTINDVMARWRFIVVFTVVFALVVLIASFLMPVKYQSNISMIVIQKQSTEKIDAFSATKSAEFLSNVFTKVVYTTSFFNAVQDAPFDVQRDFSQDSEKRDKEWKKMISVRKANNTSIIDINVLDASRKTAEETVKAIAYTLATNNAEYHGGGNFVEVRLIDGPNTPIQPATPNLVVNTVIGIIIGFFISIVLIYLFPNKFISKNKENIVVINTAPSEDGLQKESDEAIVQNHFQNVQGEIEFDEEENDIEINNLHNRISAFNGK